MIAETFNLKDGSSVRPGQSIGASDLQCLFTEFAAAVDADVQAAQTSQSALDRMYALGAGHQPYRVIEGVMFITAEGYGAALEALEALDPHGDVPYATAEFKEEKRRKKVDEFGAEIARYEHAIALTGYRKAHEAVDDACTRVRELAEEVITKQATTVAEIVGVLNCLRHYVADDEDIDRLLLEHAIAGLERIDRQPSRA